MVLVVIPYSWLRVLKEEIDETCVCILNSLFLFEAEPCGYEVIVDDIYKTVDHLTNQGTGKIYYPNRIVTNKRSVSNYQHATNKMISGKDVRASSFAQLQ